MGERKLMHRLTGRQHFVLLKWIEQNKQLVMETSDEAIAEKVSAELKEAFNCNHVLGARHTLGYMKAAVGKGVTKERPTLTELDEEAFVKLNCLARCVDEIYEQFDLQTTARCRLRELFTPLQLKRGGNGKGGVQTSQENE